MPDQPIETHVFTSFDDAEEASRRWNADADRHEEWEDERRAAERKDHPAALIDADKWDADAHPFTAATFLRHYEERHGVTFEALDVQTLDAARAAYQQTTEGETPSDRHGARDDLVRLVGDLFGWAE
jgi:hypothetical protein